MSPLQIAVTTTKSVMYDLEKDGVCTRRFVARGNIQSFDFEVLPGGMLCVAVEYGSWIDLER